MSTGYTKLFGSIVHSTIWRAPDHIRLVWITMLALANRDGIVEASVPGLADAARVTLQQCENALEALMSPDPYSRTKDHEGRRIATVQGGWVLLNYEAYRDRMSKEHQKEQARWRKRRQRERERARHADVTPVTESHACHDKQKQKKKQKKKADPPSAGSRAGARAREAEAPLPDDWAPTREQIHWAETHYLDYDLAVDEADAFKAYFTAGRGRNERRTARGWAASLQSWFRKVDGYRPERREVPLPTAKARKPTRFEQEQLALEGGGA